jgi:hypothetical protein
MQPGKIHFEVFARRAGARTFNLELATEDRELALETAEKMVAEGGFNAVKVTKETLDPETGEFNSIAIYKQGEQEKPKAKVDPEDRAPPCVSPADLYNVHSRDCMARLLEGWLNRNRVTPFELLHRPDLIEKLEASGNELQHAVQKISVPEAQASGQGVHEVIRKFQQLIERAIERVLSDKRKGILPGVADASEFAPLCARLGGEPERQYLLGAAVAGFLAPAMSWSDKVNRLLDLADAAPKEGPARSLALNVLEQPLGEILRSRVGLADLLQADLDLGEHLAALTRLAAADAVDALATADNSISRYIPTLSGPAERLAHWLDGPQFEGVQAAISRRILQELTSLRRLRPSDARGEIEILRALAMALTAASGRLLPLEEVRSAFIERSKMLVAGDFVGAYLLEERSACQEATDLVVLLENVTGGANKRQAMRWLLTTIASLRFETEMASGTETPSARLAKLAELYRQVSRSGSDAAGLDTVLEKLGEIGARIEAQAKLSMLIGRAAVPLTQKLSMLVKMAAGETAPPGPAADRAKAEAMKLVRDPAARDALAKAPEVFARFKALMHLDAAA